MVKLSMRRAARVDSVSYTHLDVYKRQELTDDEIERAITEIRSTIEKYNSKK